MLKIFSPLKKYINTFSDYTIDQKLIILTVISIFLPFFVVIVPVVIICFFAISSHKRLNRMTNLHGSFLVFLLLPILCTGAVLHSNWIGLLAGIALWIFFIFSLYLRVNMTEKLFQDSIALLLTMSFFAAFWAIIQFIIDSNVRAAAMFFNPNYYGFMIEIFILLASYRLVFHKGSKKFNVSAIAINIIALFLTNCRTAWVAVFVGLTVLLLMSKKYKFLSFVLLGAGAVLLCAAFLPDIMPRGNTDSIGHAADQRQLMWWISAKSALNSPFFGRGAYGYLQIWNMYEIGYKTVHCHNIFINSFLDVGIIGSILWIAYILLYPTITFKRRKHSKFNNDCFIIVCSTIVMCLSHCITDIPVLGIQTLALVFIVLSCVGISEKNQCDMS